MIDKKNAILIAVVLFIAAVVGLYVPYLQYSGQENTITPVSTSGTVSRIVYTNKGFEPASITVGLGATVEWVNESDKLMWVASNDHPSHSILPGFDQKGSEGNVSAPQSSVPVALAHTGVEIYRYTFEKRGRWDYHNHLVPADRGTVVVE